MENIAITDSKFYEFSDLVLSEIANMNILERGRFSDNYLEAKPLPISFKCIPLEDNDFVPQNVVNKFRELNRNDKRLFKQKITKKEVS